MADFEARRRALVASLERSGYVRDPSVRKAFLAVPREEFLSPDLRADAYVDSPLPIGAGQTISAPSMIAIMLEEARLASGDSVLEAGTGSGYNAALLASIVGPRNVVSVERISELAAFGRDNLRRTGFGDVEVVVGDGTLGYPPRAPYECIMATAGAPRLPAPWKDQTKVGGRIVAPIGRSTFTQVLTIATHGPGGRWDVREGTPCAFVPLVGAEGWRED